MPEYPAELAYLWSYYMTAKRSADPLRWEELRAWSEMTATPICGRDAEALMRIDNAVLGAQRDV